MKNFDDRTNGIGEPTMFHNPSMTNSA